MTAHRSFGHSLVVLVLLAACGSQAKFSSVGQDLSYVTPQSSGTGSLRDTLPPCGSADGGTCDATSAGGRMTGGGFVLQNGMRVTHGFELNCDATQPNQHLEVNWSRGHRFSLDGLKQAVCIDQSGVNAGPPAAGFNLFVGDGTGLYDGQPGATIQFAFSDAGEPGRNDEVAIVIHDAAGNEVLSVSGTLAGGNQQAHSAQGG